MRAATIVAALAPLAFLTPSSLAAPSSSPAAAALADTPAGRQALRLLNALTTGDDVSFLKFLREAYPNTKTSPETWLETRHDLSTLELHAVTAADATHADLSVFDPGTASWATISVTINPAPPYPITRFSLQQSPRPADVPAPPKLQPPQLAADVEAKAKSEAAADHFSGAVLIAKNGQTLLDRAYGLADREARKPNTTDTQFRFGSMGKMFTAVGIMQLAQAGKIDLAAPIGRYLKDYPNQDIATKVTIDELLTHTGRTGDIFGPEFDAHRQSLRDLKDYVALYGARAPLFAPGSRPQYSNYGFILLGRIIEVVSGLSYDDYVQQHIFTPAHMTATGMQPETTILPDRAVGYMTVDGRLKSAADTQPLRGTSAGGGYSTVGDLKRFADALMSNQLLDAAHTQLLTDGGPVLPDGTRSHYDFGGQTSEGRRFVGHDGGAPGMNGELRIFPDQGFVVVVLANRDPPVATALAGYIADRLP